MLLQFGERTRPRVQCSASRRTSVSQLLCGRDTRIVFGEPLAAAARRGRVRSPALTAQSAAAPRVTGTARGITGRVTFHFASPTLNTSIRTGAKPAP